MTVVVPAARAVRSLTRRNPATTVKPDHLRVSPSADRVLRLQRTAGNRAVSIMVSRVPDEPSDPRPRDPACPDYEPGEVRRSRSPGGLRSPDVRDEGNGMLLVTDFGVGRNVLRRSTREEPVFRKWRARFEENESYRLKIFGFSDCVGRGGVNEKLRYARAMAVYNALLPDTQSRVTQMGPFGSSLFLVGNATPASRATNRGVLVAFEQQHSGEDIEGETNLLDRVVKQSRRALTDSPYDQEFLKCWLDKLHDSGFDDSYVNGFKWRQHTQEIEPATMDTLLKRRSISDLESVRIIKHAREDLIAGVVPGEDVSKTRVILRGIANRYHEGAKVYTRIAGKPHGSTINPGDRQLIEYIDASAKRPSLHRCYLDFYTGG